MEFSWVNLITKKWQLYANICQFMWIQNLQAVIFIHISIGFILAHCYSCSLSRASANSDVQTKCISLIKKTEKWNHRICIWGFRAHKAHITGNYDFSASRKTALEHDPKPIRKFWKIAWLTLQVSKKNYEKHFLYNFSFKTFKLTTSWTL